MTVSVAAFVCVAPALAPAQQQQQPARGEFDRLLDEAVGLLGEQEYERGLAVLDAAERLRSDPRLTYYRGYGLEKLGRCQDAKARYHQAARDAAGTEKLRVVAIDALAGIDERCAAPRPAQRAADVDVEADEKPALGAGRTGWKIFGVSSIIVGATTLAFVPIQISTGRRISEVSHPYFERVYGCDVEYGKVGGDGCDADGLFEDSVYQSYDEHVRAARKLTVQLVAAGVGLIGLGAVTLLTVGLTRPSVSVGVSPGGVGLAVEF